MHRAIQGRGRVTLVVPSCDTGRGSACDIDGAVSEMTQRLCDVSQYALTKILRLYNQPIIQAKCDVMLLMLENCRQLSTPRTCILYILYIYVCILMFLYMTIKDKTCQHWFFTAEKVNEIIIVTIQVLRGVDLL